MKKLTLIIASFAFVISLSGLGLLSTASPVSAATCSSAKDCVTKGVNSSGGSSNKTNLEDFITNIINLLLFLVGAIAVIMIIVGGITYTISNGDQAKLTTAKNTILYAIVGLVVAGVAYAIVNFVVKRLV